MAISLRIQGVLLLAAVGVMGCQTTPRLRGTDTQTITGSLANLNPSDVAVAPLRYGAPGLKAPEAELRRAAQIGLARRRYSPLALHLVDERVAKANEGLSGLPGIEDGMAALEASYAAGDLGEDAVLQLTIHRWDARHWSTRRSLDVDIEARMIDPADPFGPPLWGGRTSKIVDASGTGGLDSSGQKALEAACASIYRELFHGMPKRNIDPTPSPEGAAGGSFSGSEGSVEGGGL